MELIAKEDINYELLQSITITLEKNQPTEGKLQSYNLM